MEGIKLRYLGNKTRLAKELSPILTKHLNGKNWYIEPFAGAFGMISNIDYPHRVAYDNDKYIISLMKAVRDGWTPPEELDNETYKRLQRTGAFAAEYGNNDELTSLVAFAGYGCSFGGKWFAGMARGGVSGGKERNHVAESSRNLVKMRPKLQSIKMQVSDYRDSKLGEGNVIYCDPPYSTGTQYKSAFNSEEFWEWIRTISQKNFVYVSEYNAPDDFISVWQKEHKSGIDHAAKTHKSTVEKLFTWDNTKSLVHKESTKLLYG